MTESLNSQEKLARISSLTAIIIAVAIAVVLPVGFFAIALQYELQRLSAQANHAADNISKIIFIHPENWMLQEPRLEDYLEISHRYDQNVRLTVLTTDNRELTIAGDSVKFPVKTHIEELSDGSKTVGWIRAELSLRPLLWQAFSVFLGALVLGVLVNVALRVLPFAALRRTMDSLNRSQKRLEQEIKSKDSAFAELQRLSDTIRYQALHDDLTSLPNRTYFLQELANAVNTTVDSNHELAVLLIDLDRFKEVNDTLGHHMGDEVLVQISQRLSDCLSDDGFLARLGGDEYVIILRNSSNERLTQFAKRITSALQPHVVVDEYHLSIPGSIGIAQYPEHGASPSQLLRNADIAMYQAKRTGQPYYWYQSDLDDNTPGRLVLTADLRQAIDQQTLELHYQPKIDLMTGAVVGVEALARWHHSDYGFITPGTFIPIAEQAGMINALTNLVLDLSMKQLRLWRDGGLQINIAINISAKNLQNVNFPQHLKMLAEQYRIDPCWLVLEVTESSIMADPEQAKTMISDLGKWGVKIAIDDYGTGYSSLAYVKRLEIHELKIDRSFVLNMVNDADDQVIVKSTIDLAHSLNLAVTAEGIEDDRSLDLLRGFGCDFAQGFHICKPIKANELEIWLAQNEKQN